MDYKKLIDQCHSAAKANGWWDEPRPHEEIILLIKSELFEAMDAYRSDKRASKFDVSVLEAQHIKEAFKNLFKLNIKDTFEDEIADTAIRIFDYLGFLGLPVKKSVINMGYSGAFMAVLGHLDGYLAGVRSLEPNEFMLINCLLTLEELARTYDFDLHTHIQLKLRYNATRGKKHGKKF